MLMAGAGASKAGTAKVMDSYNSYVFEMEKINIEREKAKLSPRPILSKQEWLKGQEIGDSKEDLKEAGKWDAWNEEDEKK